MTGCGCGTPREDIHAFTCRRVAKHYRRKSPHTRRQAASEFQVHRSVLFSARVCTRTHNTTHMHIRERIHIQREACCVVFINTSLSCASATCQISQNVGSTQTAHTSFWNKAVDGFTKYRSHGVCCHTHTQCVCVYVCVIICAYMCVCVCMYVNTHE